MNPDFFDNRACIVKDDLVTTIEHGDLEYRERQLRKMQEEAIDLEEVSGGVYITDLEMPSDPSSTRKPRATSTASSAAVRLASSRTTLRV